VDSSTGLGDYLELHIVSIINKCMIFLLALTVLIFVGFYLFYLHVNTAVNEPFRVNRELGDNGL